MITKKEMKEAEEFAESIGLSKLQLMEHAGRAASDFIEDNVPDMKDKRALILCGQGNNGGDGFVLARYLREFMKVDVIFLGEEESLSEEARSNYEALKELDANCILHQDDDRHYLVHMPKYALVVDAMVGVGLTGHLRAPYDSLVRDMNLCKNVRVSLDVPTGLNVDTGEMVEDLCVNPDYILTYHDTKLGLDTFGEKVIILDIGIPV